MSKPPVTNPLEPRCGNCKFWDRIESNDPRAAGQGACLGVPPTPVMIAAKPRQFGGFDIHAELLSPNVPEQRPPCALYAPAHQIILGDAKGPVSKLDS